MPLTDLQCKKAKPRESEYSLPHAKGLFLMVRTTGNKFWMCDFVKNHIRHKFSYGEYPYISVDQAIKAHTLAREAAEAGHKPSEIFKFPLLKEMAFVGTNLREIERRLAEEFRASEMTALEETRAKRMTFGSAADRYYVEHGLRNWKHPEKMYYPIRKHLLPRLGHLALEDIGVETLRELCYEIRERNGVQVALHARGGAARVFDFAIEHGWCVNNPGRAVKGTRIGERGKRKRWLKPDEIRRYLTCLYQADCYRGYKIALHLLLMLLIRKEELCGASWREIDVDSAELFIPASRMKAGVDHQVLLPRQAIKMLLELRRLGGGSEWVFPMKADIRKAMSGALLNRVHNAVIEAAEIKDYKIHDHRHTASTNLRDKGFMPEVIGKGMSHSVPGIAGIYSHAQYKNQRLIMMQGWADYLDSLMTEQKVLQENFGLNNSD